jgi:hypothetical protein
MAKNYPLGNYGLAVVLALIFFAAWIGMALTQWQEFEQDQQEHGEEATVKAFMPEFWSATLQNWQSEFLQLLLMTILSTYLVYKGSAESRDSQDEMQQAIKRIEEKLSKRRA